MIAPLNLHPENIVQAALTKRREIFSLPYSDTRFLIIQLPADAHELTDALAFTVARRGALQSQRPPPSPLDFNTQVMEYGTLTRRAARSRSGFDATALRTREGNAPHFVLPLRKRPDSEALSERRISVGRARNKDVILRDPSVSKFHCWFDVDPSGACGVADAGSKNGTFVNGAELSSRVLVALEPGDRVRIGNIDAIVCSAETLWDALDMTTTTTRKLRLGAR